MRVLVITPPEPLVSLATAKGHLRINGSAEDALITGMIAAASAAIDGPDGTLGRAIGKQTLELVAPAFGRDLGQLPYPPLIEIKSVTYRTTAGVSQVMASSAYVATGKGVIPAAGTNWPTPQDGPEAVRVRYDAGYAVTPAPIHAAVLLMVGDLYHSRQSFAAGTVEAVPSSATVESLLAPYWVYR